MFLLGICFSEYRRNVMRGSYRSNYTGADQQCFCSQHNWNHQTYPGHPTFHEAAKEREDNHDVKHGWQSWYVTQSPIKTFLFCFDLALASCCQIRAARVMTSLPFEDMARTSREFGLRIFALWHNHVMGLDNDNDDNNNDDFNFLSHPKQGYWRKSRNHKFKEYT